MFASNPMKLAPMTFSFVLLLALIVTQPRIAHAIQGGRVPEFPTSSAGSFSNACKYQVWTNGTAIVPFVSTPTPAISGLGTPAFSGYLTTATAVTSPPFIDVVNGSTVWSVPHGSTTDNICVQWNSYFYASGDGTYLFEDTSDDGSVLFIGSTQVIFNNFSQGSSPATGQIVLNAGFHLLTVMYGNGTGAYGMVVQTRYSATNPAGTFTAPTTLDSNMFLRLLATPTVSPPQGAYSQNQITLQINEAWPTVANVSTATESGNTVTITTTSPHGLSAGQAVLISNVGIASYNGTYTVATVPTSTTFTYANPTANLAAASGGTVSAIGTIYYTTDGTTPTSSSQVYSAPFTLVLPKTLMIVPALTGYDGSPTATAIYTQIPTSVPTFSIPSGNFSGAQTLTVSSTTSTAFIYYTTDGTTPTAQNYTGVGQTPVTLPLSAAVTVNAFALAFDYSPSAVVSASYTRTDLPPKIVSCLASGNPNKVNVTFASTVTSASANVAAHYSIDNGATVTAATLDTFDNKMVRLATSTLTPGIAYNLTVTSIVDVTSGVVLASATTPFQYFNGGGLLYERWDGVSGSKVTDLTNPANPAQAFFPDFPTAATAFPAGVRSLFEIPKSTGLVSYGSRMSGYFVAPATGLYNFAISADDTATLSISSDDDPSKKTTYSARVTVPSLSRQWNYDTSATPENKISNVSLAAGNRYYVEMLQKQNTSADNAAVAFVFPPDTFFDVPGSETVPISAIFDPNGTGSGPIQLSPAIDALRVVKQPVNITTALHSAIQLVFDVSGSAPRTVQWSLDSGSGPVDIPGANFGIYAIPNMSAANAGTYVCRMTNAVTTAPLFSTPAVVTLIDTTPATFVSITDNFDSTAGGKTVVVTGTDFIAGTSVTIGGKQCPILSVTSTAITCTVPALGVKGFVSVVVTKPDNQPLTVVNGFMYDDRPVASAQTLTILEDTPTSGATLSATDPSDKIVSFRIVTPPQKGTVALAAATLQNKGSTGTMVTITTTAAHGFTMGQTVSVACNPPDANIDSVAAVIVSVPTSTTFTYSKTATVVASTPTGGTAQLITNTPAVKPFTGTLPFVYSPNANANNVTAPAGPETFTFVANDGILDSLPVTVTINITPVNDAPVANNTLLGVNPGTTTNGMLSATDVDGDALTYSLVALPTQGTVMITNPATGAYTYTPNGGAAGMDSFTFKANDGQLDSNIATVTVAIEIPPTGQPQSLTILEDTPTSNAVLTATSPNNLLVSFAIAQQPAKGIVTLGTPVTNSPTPPYTATLPFTYTPNPNANNTTAPAGPDTFTFTANDGMRDSSPVTVTINITPVNDPPIAASGMFTTLEGAAFSGLLSASDVDGDALTFSIVSQGTKGTATITNAATGAFTYTPNLYFNGMDTFTFKANDGTVDSNTATVTMTITPVNHPPVASSGAFTTNEETTYSGSLIASDVDGDALQYAIASNPSKGMVLITNPATGAFTYTPNANTTGSDSFTFTASDGKAQSNTATVNVTIAPVNHAPVANNGSAATLANSVFNGSLSASDRDGDPLQYLIVTGASKGTVQIPNAASSAYIYKPNPGASGADSFTFKVNDGQLDSNAATISITISAAASNSPPVAAGNSISVLIGATFNGTLIASDPDNNILTYSIVGTPSKGALVLNDPATGAFSYTPSANAGGSDSFTFKANDGQVDSNAATITIAIALPNVAPVANNGSLITFEDTSFSSTLVAVNTSGTALTYALVANPSNGTVALDNPATGAYTYTPNLHARGTDSFTFKASNGLDSNTARFRL